MAKQTLFLCMGSACHQMGVYEVLPKLLQLIQDHDLDDVVELKGSFCLESCSHGIVMKFQDHHFLDISPHSVEDVFVHKILPLLQTAEVS